MNAIIITSGIAAAIVILTACMRRAVRPALTAYRLGLDMGRMLQAKKDTEPSCRPGRALDAVLAWLMPLRAARIIRDDREHKQLLIRTLAYAVAGGAEPVMHERPDSDWYDRPMPVAALTALLRPARAVRRLRSNEEALVYMIDALLAQGRKHQEAGELAAGSS